MGAAPAHERPKHELQILSVGLLRSGSLSMTEALTILGYKNVWHTLRTPEIHRDFGILSRAADSYFPLLSSFTGEPFGRAGFDEVWGHCEAVTDVSCIFASQLFEAYPEAKVILVEREYERWEKSAYLVIDNIFNPLASLAVQMEKLTGSNVAYATQQLVNVLFGALDTSGMKANARRTYADHHRMVRERVAPERLLLYKLGSGWKPLCDFVGKPVPDVEFPCINDADYLTKSLRAIYCRQIIDGLRTLVPMVALVAMGVVTWRFR